MAAGGVRVVAGGLSDGIGDAPLAGLKAAGDPAGVDAVEVGPEMDGRIGAAVRAGMNAAGVGTKPLSADPAAPRTVPCRVTGAARAGGGACPGVAG